MSKLIYHQWYQCTQVQDLIPINRGPVSAHGTWFLSILILYDGQANAPSRQVNFCEKKSIQIEAYAPLARAMRFNSPTIRMLSEKYQCTPAQLMVKWSLQKGYVTLPKSVKKDRIISNVAVDNFMIEDSDMKSMGKLDEHLVTGKLPPPTSYILLITGY